MLKKVLKITAILATFLTSTYFLLLFIFPQFGGRITKEQKNMYSKSKQYDKGRFKNRLPSDVSVPIGTLLKFFKKDTSRKPSRPLVPMKINPSLFTSEHNTQFLFSWFGHSSFIINAHGSIIVLDPMFGKTASPFSWIGSKRFSKQIPLSLDSFPNIDVVIISHDHYDHLDYPTIKKINHKVKQYLCPLGVSVHLRKWGVQEEKITELDWWSSVKIKNIEFHCTPARHFSGRGLLDKNKTLWSSWVIKQKNKSIFFSGDSGYDTHFKTIGTQLGPFDLAFVECGQYNEHWPYIHMFPEQTVQAALDLNTKQFMPIHWGGFALSLHNWKTPVRRAKKEAEKLKQPVITPKIGQIINLENLNSSSSDWWEDL